MVTTQPIFHRGDTTEKEENTMPAFKAALARNRGFEFDIRPTKDNTFAVIHNPTWDETCRASTIPSGISKVIDTTQAQVDQILTKGGLEIPSLVRVLNAIEPTASPVLIDMKDGEPWPDEMVVRMNELVVKADVIYKTFVFLTDLGLIAQVRTFAPDVRVSYRPLDDNYSVAETQGLGCKAIQPRFETLSQKRVNAYQDAGLKVIVQGNSITSKADLDQCKNWGVNYVLMDAADWDKWSS